MLYKSPYYRVVPPNELVDLSKYGVIVVIKVRETYLIMANYEQISVLRREKFSIQQISLDIPKLDQINAYPDTGLWVVYYLINDLYTKLETHPGIRIIKSYHSNKVLLRIDQQVLVSYIRDTPGVLAVIPYEEEK